MVFGVLDVEEDKNMREQDPSQQHVAKRSKTQIQRLSGVSAIYYKQKERCCLEDQSSSAIDHAGKSVGIQTLSLQTSNAAPRVPALKFGQPLQGMCSVYLWLLSSTTTVASSFGGRARNKGRGLVIFLDSPGALS
eukprot:5317724-Amphidinium_carterae.1